MSRLDAAEADYKKVLEQYPRDRLTLQQLGELAKIKSEAVAPEQRLDQLKIAQGYYQRVLAIDPEDIGSHYNMMIISQKLGDRETAKKEAMIFKDLKEDPEVTSLAGTFLQDNSTIANESLPYHTHDLNAFQMRWEKPDYLAILDLK